MFECDVALGSFFVRTIRADPEDTERYEEEVHRRKEAARGVLVHEFGHCLGLAHSGAFSPDGRRRLVDGGFLEREHPRDPSMSYGVEQGGFGGGGGRCCRRLPAASGIGVARRRPVAFRERSGLPATAGTTGCTSSCGRIPWEGDPLKDRVGVFSRSDGSFLIEGLPPGDYSFWVHPRVTSAVGPAVPFNGAPHDLNDTVVTQLR